MITPAIVKAFNSFYVFLFVVIISFFIGYQVANSYNKDKPDWIKMNKAPDVDPIDMMSNEEYIKYNNDRYEKGLEERKERERIK
jgi:hypothetical protein